MKKAIVALLMLVAVQSKASGYFNFIGQKGVPIWQSSGFDVTPRDVGQTSGVHNIGLVTHDSKNGSLCTKLDLGTWCVPESWVPLQATFGGSFADQLVAGLGMSANAMPQAAGLVLMGVDRTSAPWLQSTKAFLTNTDPSKTSIRLGADFTGSIVQQGRFVPMKEAYPGRGPLKILENAAKLNISLGWGS